MPTPSPVFGWPLPTLAETADGPAAFANLAGGIEATLSDTTHLTYLPEWVATGAQPGNPSIRQGTYVIKNGVCDFVVTIAFGPSTDGGGGDLSVGIPVPALSAIGTQIVHCVLYTPLYGARMWVGAGIIDNPNTRVRPHFPLDDSHASMLPWASGLSQFTGGTVPSGPNYPYSVQNGGLIAVTGRYIVQ